MKEAIIKTLDNNYDRPSFILYKDYTNHNSIIVYKEVEEKKYFIHIDSLGNKGKAFNNITDEITEILKESEHRDHTYFIVGNEKTQRQKDLDTCSIFVYKDLKEILKNLELIDEIINSAKANMPESTLLAVSESNEGYITFSKLPVVFQKMTQFTDYETLNQSLNESTTLTIRVKLRNFG